MTFPIRLPRSVKRQIMGAVSDALKKLLRLAHENETLEEGEEDFGMILYQTDKDNPDSPILATLVGLNARAEVTRQVKTYNVDDLIGKMQKDI